MAHYDSECKYCHAFGPFLEFDCSCDESINNRKIQEKLFKEEFEKAYEYLKLIKFPVTSYYSEYEKKYAISIAKWAKEFNKKDFI